jgi:hypothetical protein
MMPGPPRWPHADWQSLEQNDPEMYKLILTREVATTKKGAVIDPR